MSLFQCVLIVGFHCISLMLEGFCNPLYMTVFFICWFVTGFSNHQFIHRCSRINMAVNCVQRRGGCHQSKSKQWKSHHESYFSPSLSQHGLLNTKNVNKYCCYGHSKLLVALSTLYMCVPLVLP